MKTLKNHLILFDEECPMCRMYTNAFVSTGLLDQDGRAAYQELPAQACPMVDRQRAANEIALVNQETGEVTYGIESLFKIFALMMPFLGPLFRFKPFIWLMSKVYAFIAYNRRVIVPPAKGEGFQFQPTFKLHYRIAYLVFTWFVTSYILSSYTGLMGDLLPVGHAYREYFICGGQILFQGLVIILVNKEKTWAYLGNMMTISFAGALLLLPAMLLSVWFAISPVFYVVWFMAVAGLMLLEHIRRCSLLKIGWVLTITWVSYRVAILLVILLNA
ncbi:DCC1-like thiol-disulfide oxidoreductase family protein [Pedobacter nyackensis]|uniref:Predicted thiol-disulfide oxidoreductase YuxK, DCC family n=1 Tax=Pedobacter nyackensis TaxID=475255 RepID=A0A1W2F0V3_9SPHI|nr:DCC1-like thiol-disulfide oxidoreductase family protein [Pedobacter nyackensis]SMD15462.1 Predicted thiol-disulfide oxidoreductase YuxK, DCC family [Pedobacter nyackensis]